MSLIYAYNALEVLSKEGFEKMRPPSIQMLFLLYEMGELTKAEIAKITGRDWQAVNVSARRLIGFGLIDQTSTGLKLTPKIRELLTKSMQPEGAYAA